MRVLKMDPMLILTIVVGLGVVLTMKLANIDNSITSAEEKAQQLRSNVYSSAAYRNSTLGYSEDKRSSKLSINSW
jgi:hypothetical protein